MKIVKNPSRYWLQKEITYYAGKIPAGSTVLDAGGGDCIYKKHFSHCHYESADFTQMAGLQYNNLTYICDLTKIPVEDNRYDFILFTQVMEHVPEPELVLCELRRVLKPGGQIFCSAPLIYHEHGAPYDFYRYTQFGLKYLFSKAGFLIDGIERMEGFFQTAAYMLGYICDNLPTGQRMAKRILRYYAGQFQKYEMKNRLIDVGIPKNYILIATKPK